MKQRAKIRGRLNKIVEAYLKAKESIIGEGFAAEIDWQAEIRFSQITESDFLREAAWVVLSSGMRETVIRLKFNAISKAFYYWRNANDIIDNSEKCRNQALKIFHNQKKIDAIISIAEQISVQGFGIFKTNIQTGGVKFIQSLPFMGPATSYHFAKNIGLDVVKPDRHLLRVAATAGFESPKLLCEEISKSVGDRVCVIDLVIWRFATLNANYTEYFA